MISKYLCSVILKNINIKLVDQIEVVLYVIVSSYISSYGITNIYWYSISADLCSYSGKDISKDGLEKYKV